MIKIYNYIQMRNLTCFMMLLSVLAGCNKADNEVDEVMEQMIFPEIVLVDGTRNGDLLKMVSGVTHSTATVNLFDPLTEKDSLAVASANEICVVLDGRNLDDAGRRSALKEMWDRFYSFHAHKVLLLYDGREAATEQTAWLVGFYSGQDYYIRSFGRGSYCKVIERTMLSEALLSQTIDEVREQRSRGVIMAGEEEDVTQYTFIRTIRFNHYRASDDYYNSYGDLFTIGSDVDQVTAAQRRRSAYGDFIVQYTIYSAKDYTDKYLLVEIKGAGFTTNILRRIDVSQHYKAHVKNFMRFYDTSIKVIGKTAIPTIVQALPSAENNSISVSETMTNSHGFKMIQGKPSITKSFNMTNIVTYDQPSFSTRPWYETDAPAHSYKHTWETRPEVGYHGHNIWYNSNTLDVLNLFNFWLQDNGTLATMNDITDPVRFPIPFYSFSPQVSLFVYIEDDPEITVEATVEIHWQDEYYNPFPMRTEDIARPYVPVTDRVNITFSGDDVFWQ